LVWWPTYARLTRSLFLGEKERDYVKSARVLGYGPIRISVRHILPNISGPLIGVVTIDIGSSLTTLAGLSFLGLTSAPPTAEWGSMVADGTQYVSEWWVAGFPGLAIGSRVLACNF